MRRLISTLGGLAALAGAAPATAQERTVTLRYGPIDVSGYEIKYRSNDVPAPKIDGFITRMHARVVDKEGNEIPVTRMMVHHIAFLDTGSPTRPKRDETYCPNALGRRFYGTGEENQTMVMPAGYGYRVREDDRWRANWMLMNHGPGPDAAYIEYTMSISESDLVPVRPHWIGVVPCKSDPIFDVPGGGPPGSVHRKTAGWTVPANGRIVAAGGHIHGGSYGLALRQPRCDNRLLVGSRPLYGDASHPYYNVLPVLHEPGPIATSWTSTRMGIGVRKGDRLSLSAFYDATRMHVRAMGIMHVYIAPPVRGASTAQCPPRPPDLVEAQEREGASLIPPAVDVPLTGIGPDGRARTIDAPPGPFVRVMRPGPYTMNVKSRRLHPANLSVPTGTVVRWRFRDRTRHDITVANGPSGFSSQPMHRSQTYARKLDKPGVYRLYCSLHPVSMTQRVVVR